MKTHLYNSNKLFRHGHDYVLGSDVLHLTKSGRWLQLGNLDKEELISTKNGSIFKDGDDILIKMRQGSFDVTRVVV